MRSILCRTRRATSVRPGLHAERRSLLIGLALVALAGSCLSASAALPTAEMARVERLLSALATRHDVRFVRNGKDYDNDSAVAFLRGKLRAMGGDLKTAEEFVDKLATRSSTTGKPYLVRLSDGRESGAGEFLRAELNRLDRAAH